MKLKSASVRWQFRRQNYSIRFICPVTHQYVNHGNPVCLECVKVERERDAEAVERMTTNIYNL